MGAVDARAAAKPPNGAHASSLRLPAILSLALQAGILRKSSAFVSNWQRCAAQAGSLCYIASLLWLRQHLPQPHPLLIAPSGNGHAGLVRLVQVKLLLRLLSRMNLDRTERRASGSMPFDPLTTAEPVTVASIHVSVTLTSSTRRSSIELCSK